MTVNTTPVEISYTGNASTTIFALPFAFAANAHVKVYLGGVLQNSGYSITGAGNPSGGTLTMTTAPGSGVALRARRVTPLTQDIDVVNNATVFASSLETGLDYALMRQQEEAFDRVALGVTFAIDAAAVDADAAAAAASAVASASSAASALAAKTAAETAEANAETAETNAEAAQGLSEDARDLSQQYASDAAVQGGFDVPIYASVASAQAATITAGVKSIQTQYRTPTYTDLATLNGGALYARTSLATITSAGYPATAYFRSTDRFMPDGTTDAVNGGYWLNRSPSLEVRMFGTAGTSIIDATTTARLNGNRAVLIPDNITSTGLRSLGASSKLTGKGVITGTSSVFLLDTGGRHEIDGPSVDGNSASPGVGLFSSAATAADLDLTYRNARATNLIGGVVRVDAHSRAVRVRLESLTSVSVLSLVNIASTGSISGGIFNCDLNGSTQQGVVVGSNSELLQRGWTAGFSLIGNSWRNVKANNASSAYSTISYLPKTLNVGNIYNTLWQDGAGDNEGDYGKTPFGLRGCNILEDQGDGEAFTNVKGLGWPEATYATKALADAAVGGFVESAHIRVTADESQAGSPTASYLVNASSTALVLATGAWGHSNNIVNQIYVCSDAHAAKYAASSLTGIKLNTDDAVVGDIQFYGKFRHAILTAGGEANNNLCINNVFWRGGNTPINVGAIQFSGTTARNVSLSNATIVENANADAVQISGGEGGADYTITNLICRDTRRGVAMRAAVADKIDVNIIGGKIKAETAFYLHGSRLKSLKIEGVDIDASTFLFDGTKMETLNFIFRNNTLAPKTTTNATPLEMAIFPVPQLGALRSQFRLVGVSAADTFEWTGVYVHRELAGTVSLIGSSVSTAIASGGAAAWAMTVDVTTHASSGRQMVRVRATGAAATTIKWTLYADCEGGPA